MQRRALSVSAEVSCERRNNVACSNTKKREKPLGKPKKNIASKKPPVIGSAAQPDGKCSSTGKLSSRTRSTATKHVTKSDLTVSKKQQKKVIFDRSHQCGDNVFANLTSDRLDEDDDFYDSFSNISTLVSRQGAEKKKKQLKSTQREKSKPVKQYYKNENFQSDSHEIKNEVKKESELMPIKELPEITRNSSDCYLESEKTSVEDQLSMAVDSDKQESLRQLKEFREKNYFECHSSATRVTSKADVTSLRDHKCEYRFYLNERLFPVPLNADHNNTVRCTICHLPYQDNRPKVPTTKCLNGTIQAKVKLGAETQDVTLLLPVQEPLIIRERRVERSKAQDDVMYFGIVKLATNGHSMFNPNLPEDSLALKYQKGYREFSARERCAYDSIGKGDVLII